MDGCLTWQWRNSPPVFLKNELNEGRDVEEDCDGGLGGQKKTYQGSHVVREDKTLNKK